jgi:hypothetical protein
MEKEGTLPRAEKTFEELCAEASVETDTQKLLALTQQINRLLEERENRQRTPAA